MSRVLSCTWAIWAHGVAPVPSSRSVVRPSWVNSGTCTVPWLIAVMAAVAGL
jgi:hypothetical protein